MGSYSPKALGFYDMHGNVREWCRDVYDHDLIPSGTVVDPLGPGQGVLRVTRGGSWDYTTQYCRSSSRDYESFYVSSGNNLGFRLSLQAR